MLAETTYSHDQSSFRHDGGPTYHHEGSRNKRLSDVKRGAEYYKKLDSFAEAQWKSNIPKLPEMSRKLSSLPKITTSVLSDNGTHSTYPRSSLMNLTSTPRQSMSMVSNSEATYTGLTPATHSQLSLPHNLSRIIQHRTSPLSSSPLDNLHETIEEHDNRTFNTWGTNHSPLDEKITLTPDDLRPRELPFQFRDSRKLVVKPIPKKSVPMSRVAANERDRHQRTVTNFRSRNGTIRIIRPLEPLPEIEKFQKASRPEVFDIENIEREKTFMMLERIDRILHPNKKSPRTNLGSSEEEIPGTSDSTATLTDGRQGTDDLQLSLSTQTSPRKSVPSPQISYRSRREKTRSGMGFAPRTRPRYNDKPAFKTRTPKTFIDVLQSLEISQEDVDAKCQAWINQCVSDPLSLSHPEASE